MALKLRALDWRGEQAKAEILAKAAAAFAQFALEVEGESKRVLRRGEGVRTGTLRRSIHLALPGYGWGGDDVVPSNSTPELGGSAVIPTPDGARFTIQVGSGLVYALPIHNGFGSFRGYRYFTRGLAAASPKLPALMKGIA